MDRVAPDKAGTAGPSTLSPCGTHAGRAMVEFVHLSGVFYEMAVCLALDSLDDQRPVLSAPTIEAVAKYRRAYRHYERQAESYKAWRASGTNLGSGSNFSRRPQNIDKPEQPDCPKAVRDFLNLLTVHGKEMVISEQRIIGDIMSDRIQAFVTDKNGVATRLSWARNPVYAVSFLLFGYVRAPGTLIEGGAALLQKNTVIEFLSGCDAPGTVIDAVGREPTKPKKGVGRPLGSISKDAVPSAIGVSETVTERNQRWYTRFKELERGKPRPTNEAIFGSISEEDFRHEGGHGTVKGAVNEIRRSKGETNRPGR